MRENVNISFSMFEFKPIKKKMDELGMNRYAYGRFCMMKEAGIEIDRTEKDEKSSIGSGNSRLEIENDIDE